MSVAIGKNKILLWVSLVGLALGLVGAVVAAVRGPQGLSGGVTIAAVFAGLPAIWTTQAYLCIRKLRKVELRLAEEGDAIQVITAGEPVDTEWDRLRFLARPRRVRWTARGSFYVLGASVIIAALSVGLFYVLENLDKQWLGSATLFIAFILYFGWSLGKFLHNQMWVRRLLRDGEITIGHILERHSTRYDPYVIYEFRNQMNQSFQKRETDFYDGLFEGMPIHVFYDRESGRSAGLEGSLFRFKE